MYRYEYTFVHAMGTEAIYEPVHLGVAWTSPVKKKHIIINIIISLLFLNPEP